MQWFRDNAVATLAFVSIITVVIVIASTIVGTSFYIADIDANVKTNQVEIRHLQEDMTEVKQDVEAIRNYLLPLTSD